MKKYLSIASWLAAPLVLVIALIWFESDLLWKIQQFNLFLSTPLFFKQMMVTSGGFLTYVASYFTQYFYYPWLGALIFGLWVALLMWLTKRTFRIQNKYNALLLIPAALVVVANMDLGYWHYMLKLRGYFYAPVIGTSAVLALLWLASFACYVMAPESIFGSLFALGTPFLVSWRLKLFRDGALDGTISFRRALGYSLYCFFYASLLFAAAQFIYFRFLDHGVFFGNITTALQAIEPIYQQNGVDTTALHSSLSALMALSPIELSFLFMMQNFIVGGLLSPLIAAVGKRRQA